MAVYGKSGHRPRRAHELKPRLVFDRLNPWVMFTYYIIALIMAMVFIRPIFLLSELAVIIAVNVLAGSAKQTGLTLEGSLFMMVFIMVMNPLVNNRGTHIIWTIGGTVITVESVMYGLLMALSLAVVMLVFVSYNRSFTSQKFMSLFSKISPQLTLLTMITIRFVPLFLQRFKNIVQVQAIRGVSMSEGSLAKRGRAGMKLIEVLLVTSFYHALQTADSMTARGYSDRKRTSYQRYRFTRHDGVILTVIGLISAGCFIAAARGVGRLVIYPSLGQIGLRSAADWLVWAGVMVVDGLPLIIEGWEWLWWQLLKLKI